MMSDNASDAEASRRTGDLEREYADLERQRVAESRAIAEDARALREDTHRMISALGQEMDSTSPETRNILEGVRAQVNKLLAALNSFLHTHYDEDPPDET